MYTPWQKEKRKMKATAQYLSHQNQLNAFKLIVGCYRSDFLFCKIVFFISLSLALHKVLWMDRIKVKVFHSVVISSKVEETEEKKWLIEWNRVKQENKKRLKTYSRNKLQKVSPSLTECRINSSGKYKEHKTKNMKLVLYTDSMFYCCCCCCCCSSSWWCWWAVVCVRCDFVRIVDCWRHAEDER